LFCLKKYRKHNPLIKYILGGGKGNFIEDSTNEGDGDKDGGSLDVEDLDSLNERKAVYKIDSAIYYKYPLVVKDMRKVYPGYGGRKPKIANKSISLKVNRGEIFGLLGPNGAGKTTLISMLTGMFKPTSGNAWMSGYDIKN
jgi:ABC-type glutathione transport system ATPase component